MHPHFTVNQCLDFMVNLKQVPPLTAERYNYSKMLSILHRVQNKINPTAPPSVEELDLALRTEPTYRHLGLDYEQNQFYHKLLYSSDHSDAEPSLIMAFMSYRTILQLVEGKGTGSSIDVHLFVDGTFQTLPK